MIDDWRIPDALVQITVNEDEVQRRIQSFVGQKREEINRNNLRDFIDDEAEDSCARVASNVYRIKDSKGHLKLKQALNETGPEDRTEDTGNAGSFSGIKERLQDVQAFFRNEDFPLPKDIYKRLKAIENEVQHLKTISPEYSHYVSGRSLPVKTIYTVEDLEKIISAMENKT